MKIRLKLERPSPIPLNYQIYQQLKNAILAGKLLHNEKLASEITLCKNLKVTRTTVRKAFGKLEAEGLICTKKGSGSFVNFGNKFSLSWNLEKYTWDKQGSIRKVISSEIVEKNGEQFFVLTRLRGYKINGHLTWLSYEISKIKYDLVNNIEKYDFQERSLYEVLRSEYKINPTSGTYEISAISSDKNISALLSLSNNTPLVKMHEIVFDQDGNEIEDVDVIYSNKTLCIIKSNQK